MTIRVTITASGVTNPYGIALVVGTIYTVDDDFGKSLILGLKATDTDNALAVNQNAPYDQGIVSRTLTASATLAAGDDISTVTYSSASSGTLTIPADAVGHWQQNCAIVVYIAGAGIPTFAAGTGVTLRSPSGLVAGVQYGFVTAVRVAANEWTQL